ncbi:myosin-9-like [Eleutherodactylus coqui]|uniref:myosin-9-like n=1 Tax=Eleutherodactylus coqui TaxID=57060 RepID=UPI0034618EE9
MHLQELQIKITEGDSVHTALSEQVKRLQVKLEAQAEEFQRLVLEETQQRLGLSAHLKIMQDERDVFLKQLEEDAEAKRNLSKQIATLQAEVSDLKYRVEKSAVCLDSVEEQKREIQEELEATRQQYEEKIAACDKLEKVKVHLQQEIEDASVKLGLQKELRWKRNCMRTLHAGSRLKSKTESLKEVEAINQPFCLQTDVYDELEKFTVSLQQEVEDISVELG